MASIGAERLRPGDVVEVRSAEEILGTLDEAGALDAVPFMPEMLRFVGQRFKVSCRVEKICDTIASTGRRRMDDTVYLEDLRCDGSGHGGCQAGCRIYWKEAWLRRVDSGESTPAMSPEANDALARRVEQAAVASRAADGGVERWRCQATEALKASRPLKTYDLRQYWRDYRAADHGLLHFAFVLARGFVMEVGSRVGLVKPYPLTGRGERRADGAGDGVSPGDLVRIRPASEIAPTLDPNGHHLGLSFDREMVPFCGRTARVKARVERLIDERTGRMLNISRDCLILEGVACSGELSVGRWFCPRAIYPFWREEWLVPVGKPVSSEADPVTERPRDDAPAG